MDRAETLHMKDKKTDEKKSSEKPIQSRWDLDSYKAMEQRKGIYDWSRKNY